MFCKHLAFFLYLATLSSFIHCRNDALIFCAEKKQEPIRKLLLVSTLDGQLSALSIDENGLEKWRIETQPGSLLSSNIDQLELSDNSKWIRMIPSLSGSLYKFDGENIRLIPVSTEHLLGSSFRFSDDVVISGGKEIRSYGVNPETGDILYECTMSKCNNVTENAYSDVILLQRETQTVRAVEPRTGNEKWNYSVGSHDVKFASYSLPQCEGQATHYSDFEVKVVVPDGVVFLINKTIPSKILWKHEFKSPIVNIWSLIGQHLQLIDLFDAAQHVFYNAEAKEVPSLYIGMYNRQLYIQECMLLRSQMIQSEIFFRNHLIRDKSLLPMINWKPIPAARLNFKNSQDYVLQIADDSQDDCATALAVLYSSEYINGNGYYLYGMDIYDDQQTNNTTLNVTRIETRIKMNFFGIWWKEIGIIIIVFTINSFLFPFYKFIRKRFRNYASLDETEKTKKTEDKDSGFDEGSYQISYVQDTSYKSRYLEDFEPVYCLGKGGFGVVFQARNKIDDRQYAVKRITLPEKEEARERVMREVKALAKLEHQNIVRYFNAWQECPPPGWQEENDKLWRNKTRDDYLTSEQDGSTSISATEDKSKLTVTKHNDVSDSFIVFQKSLNADSKFESGAEDSHVDAASLKATNDNFELISSNNNDDTDSFIVFEKSNNAASEFESDVENSHIIDIPSSKSASRNKNGISNLKSRSPRVYLYIQMQLCQKDSLREWLSVNLNREVPVVMNIFNQIVEAVDYVHSQGLIHRDLKPSNIFFSPEGQIKVGDFGLVTEISSSVPLEFETGSKNVLDERHTANVGTKLYMSPEQVVGKPYNHKVDIYSLGIILFELLIPFSTQMERYACLINVRKNKFPISFENKFRNEHNLLISMLSAHPEARPPTSEIKSRPPLSILKQSVQ